MRCTNHPDKEARVRCSHCGKYLCDECATEEGKGRYTCLSCAAAVAAQDAVLGIERRISEREERDERRRGKKRFTYLRVFIPVSVAAGLLIASFNVYLKISQPQMDAFDPAQHPVASLIVVDQAIREFAMDHGGRVPDNLEAIQDHYLNGAGLGAVRLDSVIYIRKSPAQYELRLKTSGDEHAPALMIEGGIE
jgi:transcription initiation factor TFIIIB Brf1 subunit/transcription initiation factor TFIIB